ncbi:MAG: sulfurtransferase TusA family protein [Pseudomonadota bacterium]
MITSDKQVDTSGTRCPIPLLRAKQTLKTMQSGEVLHVISTDPSSIGDFEAMLRHLPHTLLKTEVAEEEPQTKFHVVIQKG